MHRRESAKPSFPKKKPLRRKAPEKHVSKKKKAVAEGEEGKEGEEIVEASDEDEKNRVVFKPTIADCR